MLSRNAYQQKFIDKCIFHFLNRIFEQKPKVTTVLKVELRSVLPFLGNMSNIAKTKLTKAVNKNLKFCPFKFLLKARNTPILKA